MLPNQPGAIFDEFAVFMVESSKKVTIDVEFADDLRANTGTTISDLVSTEQAR